MCYYNFNLEKCCISGGEEDWGEEGEWEWEEEEEESRHPNGNAKVRNILTLSHLSGERRGSGSGRKRRRSQDILMAMLK